MTQMDPDRASRELVHVKVRTVTDHIRAHIYNQHPMVEPRRPNTLENCERQDAPKAIFREAMRIRTLMGRVRYGAPCAVPGATTKAIELIRDYRACGNLELLVDAANYLSLEFTHPADHSTPYFEAIDRK